MHKANIERPLELVTNGTQREAQSTVSFKVKMSDTIIGHIEVYSYDTLIATLQHGNRIANVDMRPYSHTTTRQTKCLIVWLASHNYKINKLTATELGANDLTLVK